MTDIEHQEEMVEQALRTHYSEHYRQLCGPTPPFSTMWAKVAVQFEPQLAPSAGGQVSPKGDVGVRRAGKKRWFGRLSLPAAAALIILALVVLVGGGVYAFNKLDPVLRQLLNVPAAQGNETTIHQTQTIGDVTITVEQVSVNQKWIAVGFLLEKPENASDPDNWIVSLEPTLTTSDGITVPQVVGEQEASQSGLKDGKLRLAVVNYYDVKAIKGHPKRLQLHLVFASQDDPHQTVAFTFTIPFNQ
jgi:hypothetical protein